MSEDFYDTEQAEELRDAYQNQARTAPQDNFNILVILLIALLFFSL
jgi:hypothetical protein